MLSLWLAAALTAQTSFSREALLGDARVLKSEYVALHPGLLRYNTPLEVDALYQRLENELSATPTLEGAYVAFSRFTAGIKCGHSYPNFYNQPKDVVTALFEGRNRLPFFFMWIDRRMIVTRNFSTSADLRPGTEIVSINGHAASDILSTLLTVARADGSNDAKRIRDMDVQGVDTYEAFDIYFPMLFPAADTQIKLVVRSIDDKAKTITAEALSAEQRAADVAKPTTNKAAALWTFTLLRGNIGYLRMPTWEMYSSTWDWKRFLEQSFSVVKREGVNKLVIDLRRNEGGNDDVGTALLSHLVNRPTQLISYKRLIRYRTVPDDLMPYLGTWDPSFRTLGRDAAPYDKQFFELPTEAENSVVPADNAFLGKIVVLVDGSNSSATFNFAASVQRDHIGLLVGEPTGGNLRGINGGGFFFVHLPNTHIEIDLPLVGTFPDLPMPDAGLTPDVAAEPTRADVANGYDRVLQDAIGVVSSN